MWNPNWGWNLFWWMRQLWLDVSDVAFEVVFQFLLRGGRGVPRRHDVKRISMQPIVCDPLNLPTLVKVGNDPAVRCDLNCFWQVKSLAISLTIWGSNFWLQNEDWFVSVSSQIPWPHTHFENMWKIIDLWHENDGFSKWVQSLGRIVKHGVHQ